MINLSPDNRGKPLPKWDMSCEMLSVIRKLPRPHVFHDLIKSRAEEDDEYSQEVTDCVTMSSYNDGAGNGFDVVTSGRGTILLALDHEQDRGVLHLKGVLGVLPADLRHLAALGAFSCLEDDCPVGIVAWTRSEEDNWHAGLIQNDAQVIFDELN